MFVARGDKKLHGRGLYWRSAKNEAESRGSERCQFRLVQLSSGLRTAGPWRFRAWAQIAAKTSLPRIRGRTHPCPSEVGNRLFSSLEGTRLFPSRGKTRCSLHRREIVSCTQQRIIGLLPPRARKRHAPYSERESPCSLYWTGNRIAPLHRRGRGWVCVVVPPPNWQTSNPTAGRFDLRATGKCRLRKTRMSFLSQSVLPRSATPSVGISVMIAGAAASVPDAGG